MGTWHLTRAAVRRYDPRMSKRNEPKPEAAQLQLVTDHEPDEDPRIPLAHQLTRRELLLIEAGAQIAQQPTPDEFEFLHATFAQVGLPRSRVDGRTYERKTGLASIKIEAGELWDGVQWVPQPLPYGVKPRLINLYVTTYAIRNNTRSIPLGDSKRDAMRILQIRGASGGSRGAMTSFDQQMRAFAAMRLKLGIATKNTSRTIETKPVRDFQAWFVPQGSQRALWPGALELDQEYFESMREFAFPLDPRAIDHLDNSALSLDLYAYLAHRLCRIKGQQLFLPWKLVKEQFGAENEDHNTFKRNFRKALRDVLVVYPNARAEVINGGLLMKQSPPPIAKTQIAISRPD